MIVPVDGSRRVLTPGKPVRLVTVSTIVVRIDIQADATNTGALHIGGDTVSAVVGDLRGRRLEPGDIVTFENIDLYDWWFDAEIANNKGHWGGDQEV